MHIRLVQSPTCCNVIELFVSCDALTIIGYSIYRSLPTSVTYVPSVTMTAKHYAFPSGILLACVLGVCYSKKAVMDKAIDERVRYSETV